MNAASKPKPAARLRFIVAALVIVTAAGTALLTQRAETARLRAARELVRLELGDAANLREETRRLRESQIPPRELERLRTDHTALVRLRAELDTLSRAAATP